MNDDKLIQIVIFSILAIVFLLVVLLYRKDKIDIKNETRLYRSAIISLGKVILTFIIGAISTIVFLDQDVFWFKILSGVLSLLCCYIFLYTIFTARRPLLILNKDSLYSPSFGKIYWSSIKGIYIGTYFSRNFFISLLQLSYLPLPYSGEQNWATFFIVTLFDGKSYRIYPPFFSLRASKLFSILKSYHQDTDIPEDFWASDNSEPVVDSWIFIKKIFSYFKK